MSHPLSGANLHTLLSVSLRSGGPSANKLLPYLGILASTLCRTPFSLVERAALAPLLPKLHDMVPPIFILGHWRSGTTHLYNIMSLGQFGFVPPVATGLPWDFVGLGSILRPVLEKALPKHRYIDAIPVTPDSPQEDEIGLASMTPISFYHGIYFPSKFEEHLRKGLFFEGCTPEEKRHRWDRFSYFLRKLSYQQNKPLLIKNPVYTGCVADILKIFPNAKFIHIHRNPFDVYLSMRNFYQKLLPVFALQSYDHVDVEKAILSTYSQMMSRLEADTRSLTAPNYVELGYNVLDRDPIGAIKSIYADLELEGYDIAEPAFVSYLSTIKSYKKKRFQGLARCCGKGGARMGLFHREMGIFRSRNRIWLTVAFGFICTLGEATPTNGADDPFFDHRDCRKVKLWNSQHSYSVHGAEALALSANGSELFVSAYDRRSKTDAGIPPQGGLYAISMTELKSAQRIEVVSLSRHEQISGGFRPHGLAVFENGRDETILAVINRRYFSKELGKRSSRPAIELFSRIRSSWQHTGTLQHPDLCRANDLAFADRDTLIISIDRSVCAGFTISEDVLGFSGGSLVKATIGPGGGLSKLQTIDIAALNFPNGVADGGQDGAIHVALTKAASIVSYNRQALLSDGVVKPIRNLQLPGHPDNLTVTNSKTDPELIVAMYPSLPAFAAYRYRWFGTDRTASKIVSVDSGSKIRTLFEDPEGDLFSGASSAVFETLLVAGSVGDEGLLVCEKENGS